jgi:single-stranded-DNA-specific exonuclease
MSPISHTLEIQPDEKISSEELITRILQQRNIDDLDQFLNPPHPTEMSLSDFGYADEFERVFPLLQQAREENQSVVVYMDYDADGITGGTIVWETLHLLGFNVMPYIPHRVHEGYGFSTQGIDNVIDQFKPFLIISVDHGITAIDQIAYAKSKGIHVIVTDHHTKLEKNPEADGIFHIPAISGSGVGYFFAKEIHTRMQESGARSQKGTQDNVSLLQHNFQYDYVTVAAIGTIADLVSLVGPSRSLAKHGLAACPQLKNLGIKHMMKEAKIEKETLTPYDVGFVIAPRINAVGRIEHALDALRLLCTKSEKRALELAGKIGLQNTQRQDMVSHSVKQAQKQVEGLKKKGSLPKLITVFSEDWHEGIIGLIASRLMEEYYRPVFAMTAHDGIVKGSARSLPSFHITDFLSEHKDYFTGYGGHAQAAGFSLPRDIFDAFQKEVTKHAEEQITDEQLVRTYSGDVKIPVSLTSMKLVQAIQQLEPFGVGNPQPTFVSDVEIVGTKVMGKKQTHLKISGKQPDLRHYPIDFVYFNGADIASRVEKGQNVSILYKLDINVWNGRQSLQGKVVHVDV